MQIHTQIHNAKGLGVAVPMYNLIESRHNYSIKKFMAILQR